MFFPYQERDEWKDVNPISQQTENKCTMDYFRAIFQCGEISKRALELVTHAISLNPSNYTAWYYRRKLVIGLKISWVDELKYLNEMIEDNEKNYQVWFHRQKLVEHFSEDIKVNDEKKFLKKMIESDSKNYHCWSYREWLVSFFKAWEGELDYSLELIKKDVRNNSAWNYRFYVIQNTKSLDSVVRKSEIEICFKYIDLAPNNEACWNYAKGMASFSKGNDDVWKVLSNKCREFLLGKSDQTFVHCLWVLLECITFFLKSGDEDTLKLEAKGICEKLLSIDVVRSNYWRRRLAEI